MSTEHYPYCTADGRPETHCADCGRWSPWLTEWVERSRQAQSLPAKVTDPATVQVVAILMRAGQ